LILDFFAKFLIDGAIWLPYFKVGFENKGDLAAFLIHNDLAYFLFKFPVTREHDLPFFGNKKLYIHLLDFPNINSPF
tara:strand:+ start:27013 stop:27243 length:231 start_codon:yes stop_codon:yes gene_type:complete